MIAGNVVKQPRQPNPSARHPNVCESNFLISFLGMEIFGSPSVDLWENYHPKYNRLSYCEKLDNKCSYIWDVEIEISALLKETMNEAINS